MPRPVEGTSAYSPGLDGIRAVAVLGVIAYHLNFSWATGGNLGVGVFFVLSGYLITDLLVAEYKRRRSTIKLGQFWLRRARRLLPALFVMLFVVTVWATLFNRAELSALRSDMLPAIFYFSNWWYIFHHVSYFAKFGPPSPLNHLWSLAVEEQFYLIWPIVLLGILRYIRTKQAAIVLILGAAAASAILMALLYNPLADPTRVYDGTDTRAFALLIGAALAFAWPRDRKFAPITPGARRVLELAGVAALLCILIMYWRTGEYDPFVYRGGMVLLSVLTAVLIAVCVHPGSRLGSVLGVEPLRWVGERSYGIYLWQFPVIVLSETQNAGPSYLRALIQVAAILLISAASWHFVEEPIRHGALGRLWQQMRQNDWRSLRVYPRDWVIGGTVGLGVVVAALGLSGVVAASAPVEATVHNILPPKHHVEATTTTTTPGNTLPPGVTTTTAPSGQGVLAIGDSIMVDAKPYLQQMLPGIVIDAQVGQQLVQVDPAELKANGDVGDKLILELGTNGPYTVSQLEQLINAFGPQEKIVLINTKVPQPWQDDVNQVISTVAAAYPNVTLMNWNADSASVPQDFYPDDIHLDPAGAQYYAGLIVKALNTPNPPPTTTTTAPPKGKAGAKRKASAKGHSTTSSPPPSTTTTTK